MTEAALFDIPADTGARPAQVRVTAREVLDLLHQRYSASNVLAPRYICAEQVRATAGAEGLGCRTADFIAVDAWKTKGGFAIHGAEVKVSRSDWLREMKDPWKAEPFLRWCHYWWLAVPHESIARREELPSGWGLLVARPYLSGHHLVAAVQAPRRDVPPVPPGTVASLLRAVAKTAVTRAGDAA